MGGGRLYQKYVRDVQLVLLYNETLMLSEALCHL